MPTSGAPLRWIVRSQGIALLPAGKLGAIGLRPYPRVIRIGTVTDPSYTTLLVVLVAAVLGWFAYGVIGNIRRGNAVLRWMQGGLPKVGARTTLRWLGSSVVELTIGDARPPFRRLELLLVLEPRDVPWLWLAARLGGRRDTLILRAQLSAAPRFEYQIDWAASWTGRRAMADARARRWLQEPLEAHMFSAPRATLPLSRPRAAAALQQAGQDHPAIWRLAVGRDFPQLELHLPLPRPRGHDAAAFFDSVRRLAQAVQAEG